MRTLLIAILAALPAHGGWIEIRSGPYVVLSDAGERDARAALYHLEQFRFLFGEVLGREDLHMPLPVTIVVSKSGKRPETPYLGFSRDGWLGTWPAGGVPPQPWFRQLALLLIDHNLPGRMAGDQEPALASLFSTLELKGVKATLGVPPPAAERSRTWGAFSYLVTNPETATRSKVLLRNLAAGGDEGAAYRNSFNRPKAELDAEIDRYFAAGDFKTVIVTGRPLDAERAFQPIPVLPSRLRVLAGDQLMARGAAPAEVRIAYQQAQNERPGPLGFEGLGLALLAEGHRDEARRAFEAMAGDENAGARGLCELGQYERAAAKAPLWAEPYARRAASEPGPVRRAYFYKKAVELAPRQAELWRQLAQAQFDARQYTETEKSWRTAERMAASEAERMELAAAREKFVQLRYDAEAAERARLKKEEQDEVERARQDALERIHKAEAAANRGGSLEGKKIEKWWSGPASEPFSGTLERVSCEGARARLTLRDSAGKPVTMMIYDPGKVALFGTGQTTVELPCGPVKPPRRVKIEAVPRPGNPAEVVSVEFQ